MMRKKKRKSMKKNVAEEFCPYWIIKGIVMVRIVLGLTRHDFMYRIECKKIIKW